MYSKEKIEKYVDYVEESLTAKDTNSLILLTTELRTHLDEHIQQNYYGYYLIACKELNDILEILASCLVKQLINNSQLSEIKSHANSLKIFLFLFEEKSKNLSETVCENDDENINYYKRDPYENFRWGGLSGEEAYDAYWNTD